MKKSAKVAKVMREFKSGSLKSSSGKKVTNPKQAIAIGLSEAGLSKKMEAGGITKHLPTSKQMGSLGMKKGGEVKESKAMTKKEVAFMKSKGAPKSMIKHEESEMKKYQAGGMPAMANRAGAVRGLDRAAAMSGRAMPTTGRAMKSGGLAAGHKSADGVATKGKTKAKQISMRKGGKC